MQLISTATFAESRLEISSYVRCMENREVDFPEIFFKRQGQIIR